MPDYTPNYNLEQPFQEEYYNVDVQNQNMEKIDAALAKKAELGADGKIRPEQIPDGIGGGVTSFNGRTGAVMPASGDYTVGQVTGAAPLDSPVFENSASVGHRWAKDEQGEKSFSVGNCNVKGGASLAVGFQCEALGDYSAALGVAAIAYSQCSFAFGNTEAKGQLSFAAGFRTIAEALTQFVIGRCNIASSIEADRFIVGKGQSNTSRSNCFRVTDTGTYASGNYNASGADYAELFEWADRNPDGEDRAGRFVTLEGEKIRLATPEDDYIIGIVSGNPSVVGDVYDDQWQGLYLSDVFGRPIWEDVEEPDLIGPNGEVLRPAHVKHRQKVNPAYNSEEKYIPRSQRPEWDAVGLLGKLVAVDDGTCKINGWCTVGTDGMAVHSETRTKYRVMARLDESHIRILVL